MNIKTVSLYPFFLSVFLANCQGVVLVNQQFKIQLPTARKTGYDWYFKEIVKQVSPQGLLMPKEPEWVKPYGDPTYTINKESTLLNNETKIFTFQALQPGTAVLLFEKKRRYKTDRKVRESKKITITIKEK